MQQTPGFLPIPSAGSTPAGSFPRQTGFAADLGQPGPSRWNESPSSGLSAMMQNNGTPPGGTSSPSSNPHSGFHPGSFGGPLSFSALALGATQTGSSPYASSMAMSISPPRWNPGSLGGGGFSSGSFVGSVGGALGTSVGRHAEGRERELEAKYVKDFTCCGRQLSGLHELLEHYEEEHANLAPDVRMAAINAVQSNQAGMVTPTAAKRSFSGSMAMNHGDAPITPGMMDMEIDEPSPTPQALLQQASVAAISVNLAPAAASPWSNAFRPTTLQPPACVPPSVLSYAPPAPSPTTAQSPTQRQQQPQSQQQAQQPQQQPTLQQSQQQQQSAPQQQLTPEQLQAKVLKKAQKKAEREAKENGDGDDGSQPPGEKRFRCPIEGCGKVYKQANGLKYHLTRSINSGHGNVAAMGGLMALLGDGNGEDKD